MRHTAFRTRKVVGVWDSVGPTLELWPAGAGDYNQPGEALFSFVGQEAEDAVTVFFVADMRGGPAAVERELRAVFDPIPQSNIAAGMFAAEQSAWRRNGGGSGRAFVRNMEA